MKIQISELNKLDIRYLVFDFNGTLAIDGQLISGVKERLSELSKLVEIHVITADTFGLAARQLMGVKCKLQILKEGNHIEEKKKYVQNLGRFYVVAFGNGLNDNLMLKEAGVGIAVIQNEGASVKTCMNADVVTNCIIDAMDLILKNIRLKATLRS